jgi:hypothetical protein
MITPDTTINFREKKLAEFYDINFGRDRRHASAKIDVSRYRWLLTECLPVFTEDDAVDIWSALNGANTSHEDMLPILQKSVASELTEPLRSRVIGLSRVEWLAVVDACDRVGGGSLHFPLVAELKRVGLCSPGLIVIK